MAKYVIDDSTLTSIADGVRKVTGTSAKMNPSEMATALKNAEVSGVGYDQGYTDGKQAEYDAFWDAYQQNGTRYNYNNAFAGYGWTDISYNPKYSMVVTYNSNMFGQASISDTKVSIDFTNTSNLGSMFLSCTNLVTIRQLTVTEKTTFLNTFQNCGKLKNITFSGTIGTDISFNWSPLTPESMKSVILALKNYAGTDSALKYTVQFTAECWTALEADSAAPDGGTWANYVNALGWLT